MKFPAISLAFCVLMNMNAIARRTHEKPCGLRAEICVLQHATYFATGRGTGRMVFHACILAIAFMFINTQHASEIAGNFIGPLMEMQRKFKYVQLGAACGLRQSMNQSSQLTHSTLCAACGKV